MTHINKTLDAITSRIDEISNAIDELNNTIYTNLEKNSYYFGSDEHAEDFERRNELHNLREELHHAYMIIVKNF